MSMASIGTFSIFTGILLSLTPGSAKTFVSVDCTAEKVGQYGKHTMLECVVKLTVADTNIMIVTWKKEGVAKPLLAFNGENTTKESGYQFAEVSWNGKNRNLSLLITNTEVAHSGKYTCMVLTDRGYSSGSTLLKVTAKYEKPTIRLIRKTIASSDDGVECHSGGGYPKGHLRWIVDNLPWQQNPETEVKERESSLFDLSSKLTLLQDSKFSTFTCMVINANGEKEDEATYEIVEDPEKRESDQKGPSPTQIVAPVVVIGSLIVGLLLVMFCRRRARQARRHSTTPLMRDHQEVCRCELDAEQGPDQEMDYKCEDKPCLRE